MQAWDTNTPSDMCKAVALCAAGLSGNPLHGLICHPWLTLNSGMVCWLCYDHIYNKLVPNNEVMVNEDVSVRSVIPTDKGLNHSLFWIRD